MATADGMLFSWKDVERLPDLERLALALDRLPDGELVSALVVFGHESAASLLLEALALVAAEAGRPDRMRSLVKPAFTDTG